MSENTKVFPSNIFDFLCLGAGARSNGCEGWMNVAWMQLSSKIAREVWCWANSIWVIEAHFGAGSVLCRSACP